MEFTDSAWGCARRITTRARQGSYAKADLEFLLGRVPLFFCKVWQCDETRSTGDPYDAAMLDLTTPHRALYSMNLKGFLQLGMFLKIDRYLQNKIYMVLIFPDLVIKDKNLRYRFVILDFMFQPVQYLKKDIEVLERGQHE